MPFTINHNATLGIIEVTYRGRVSGNELKAATSLCIALGKKTGVIKFFVDEIGMELEASLVDMLHLPTRQYVKEAADRKGRVAVMLPASEKARESVRFYEIACQNDGWDVRVFSERQSAMDWLMNNPAADPKP